MAGIPYAKFERSDWERVPKGQPGYSATARTFRSKQNHSVIISRRQYDEHYGAVKFFGTNEKKAGVNRRQHPVEHILRPARGRKSAVKKKGKARSREVIKRQEKQTRKDYEGLIKKNESKRVIIPKTITLKNFRRGAQIRKFRLHIDHDEVESMRKKAERSGLMFGYWVIIEMVSERTGQNINISLFSQRTIDYPFTEEDFQDGLLRAASVRYAHLTAFIIAFHLNKKSAKRNGVIFKPRY